MFVSLSYPIFTCFLPPGKPCDESDQPPVSGPKHTAAVVGQVQDYIPWQVDDVHEQVEVYIRVETMLRFLIDFIEMKSDKVPMLSKLVTLGKIFAEFYFSLYLLLFIDLITNYSYL